LSSNRSPADRCCATAAPLGSPGRNADDMSG
jgi:hypothetical protein